MSPAEPELSRDEIRRAIKEILGEMLGLDPDDIGDADHLADDLDLDSMDAVDMVVDLKLRTGVKLVESDIKTVETIQDIVDVACSKLQPSG